LREFADAQRKFQQSATAESLRKLQAELDKPEVAAELGKRAFAVSANFNNNPLWVDESEGEASTPTQTEIVSPLDSFKTGLPGHPNYSHLVKNEAERRIKTKEVVPTRGELKQFTVVLEGWWEIVRKTFNPPAPPIKAGSIENVIRDTWNAALASANPIK
jgi:hypothetical protein